jgi:hypothetical protein
LEKKHPAIAALNVPPRSGRVPFKEVFSVFSLMFIKVMFLLHEDLH